MTPVLHRPKFPSTSVSHISLWHGLIRNSALLLALILTGATLLSTPALAQSPDHKNHDHSSHYKTPAIPPLIAAPAPDGTFTPLATDHMMGQTDAPITIIIYASVTCPHCGDWFTTTWPSIKTNYIETGKVRIVFREYITAPVQLAVAGFQIANCAPSGQYFTLIEHQMQNQKTIFQAVQLGKGEETYFTIAKMAGLKTVEDMNTCFNNVSGRERFDLANTLASAAEIASVPAFLINGELYDGETNYTPLTLALDDILNSKDK